MNAGRSEVLLSPLLGTAPTTRVARVRNQLIVFSVNRCACIFFCGDWEMPSELVDWLHSGNIFASGVHDYRKTWLLFQPSRMWSLCINGQHWNNKIMGITGNNKIDSWLTVFQLLISCHILLFAWSTVPAKWVSNGREGISQSPHNLARKQKQMRNSLRTLLLSLQSLV